MDGTALSLLMFAALVGLLAGKPIWKHIAERGSTAWTPILKGLFGYGVAVGLYALAAKVWGGFELHLGDISGNVVNIPFLLGGAIGGLYGAFVEVDDAEPAERERNDGASSES